MVFGNRRIPKHLILKNKYSVNKRSKRGTGWILLAIAIIVTSMMVGLKAEAHINEQNLHSLQKNFYAHI